MSEESDKTIQLFLSLGFDEKRARDTVKNAQLTASLIQIIEVANCGGGCDKAIGNLLYTIATKLTGANNEEQRKFLAQFVASNELNSSQQLTEAIRYLEKNASLPIDVAAFRDASGVGVVVTTEQITAAVSAVIDASKADLVARRYQFPVGTLIKQLRDQLKWADGKLVKEELDRQVLALLGEKTEEDLSAGKKKPSGAAKVEEKKTTDTNETEQLQKPDLPFTQIKLRDLSKSENTRVMVQGWVHNVRQGGKKLWFLELRDGTGFVQTVLNGSTKITRESTLAIWGTVARPPGSNTAKWTGLELQADYWEIIHLAPKELEEEINQDSSVKELFNKRHLVLRQERPANYLKLRSAVGQAFRQHLFDSGYFEVTPPTLVQTQAEGGSELFDFKFFGEQAYLTQSSQLYLETVCPSLGDVFCIASSYRAEESRTRRHLAEYTHIEAERPFITFDNLLDTIEDLVCDVVQRVLDGPYGELLRQVNPAVAVPQRPFMRLDYVDGLQFLKDNNIYKDEETKTFYEFGDDIPEAPERKMTDLIGKPILFCRFPVESKAFYMPKCPKDRRVTESVDLLMPGVGEIVGGSMRIWDYEELMAAYKREGLDPSPYYWFTDQRKYGSFPHGGYGLGFERFLVWLFGDEHIRNVCLYPRYRGRCRP